MEKKKIQSGTVEEIFSSTDEKQVEKMKCTKNSCFSLSNGPLTWEENKWRKGQKTECKKLKCKKKKRKKKKVRSVKKLFFCSPSVPAFCRDRLQKWKKKKRKKKKNKTKRRRRGGAVAYLAPAVLAREGSGVVDCEKGQLQQRKGNSLPSSRFRV